MPPEATYRTALAAHRREYAELSANWQLLERKAQSLAVVAGAALSAAIALLTADGFEVPRPLVICFPMFVILLLAAAYHAGEALRVQDVDLPPSGEAMLAEANRLIGGGAVADSTEFKVGLLAWEAAEWQSTCEGLGTANQHKGRLVQECQGWLVGAAGIGVLFVFLLGMGMGR